MRSWKQAVLVLLSGLLGWAAWGQGLPGLSLLFPLIWSWTASKRATFSVALAYYLAGSRVIPGAAGVFFETESSFFAGIVLWALTATLLALPWAFIRWNGTALKKVLALGLCLLLTAVPPLGLFGWLNPALGAGLLFPGWGVWSILCGLMALAIVALTLEQRAKTVRLATIPVFAVFLFFLQHGASPPEQPQDWHAAYTEDGRSPDSAQSQFIRYSVIQEHVTKVIAARPTTPKVIILPEQHIGVWNDGARLAMREMVGPMLRDNGVTLLIGAAVPVRGTQKTTNSLVIYDGHSWSQFDARFAVPISMWRPWSTSGTAVRPKGPATLTVDGRNALVSICYEDYMLWLTLPTLISNKPDIIISTANGWWVQAGAAQRIQEEHITGLARIFGIPIVRAVNGA